MATEVEPNAQAAAAARVLNGSAPPRPSPSATAPAPAPTRPGGKPLRKHSQRGFVDDEERVLQEQEPTPILEPGAADPFSFVFPPSAAAPAPQPSSSPGHRHDDNGEAGDAGVSPRVTSPPYWQVAHEVGIPSDGSGNGLVAGRSGGQAAQLLHHHHDGGYGYGQGQGQGHHGHVRTVSTDSVLPAGAITLRDNELEAERGRACWARSVEIADWVLVNGGAPLGLGALKLGPGPGAFVVYIIRVETLTGSYINIRKRYSEFDDFRRKMIYTFPNFEQTIPSLPPKSLVSRFSDKFINKRREQLQYFLNCILLNPEFAGSPVLKDFLFS